MSDELEVAGGKQQEFTIDTAERIAVLGEAGIGKTTYAADAPRPYFIDLDGAAKRFPWVARNLAKIEDWDGLLTCISNLRTKKHPYQTVVLDTLSRAEFLCTERLCQRDGVTTVDLAAKGFGRGPNEAYQEFRRLFAALEELMYHREMNVILLAQPHVIRIKTATDADDDRAVFNASEKIGEMIFNSCDHVLFATTNAKSSKLFEDKRQKATGGDVRMLRTLGGPAYMAKTRVKMPDPIPISWHDTVCHFAAARYPRLLRDTLRSNALRLNDPRATDVVESAIRNKEGVNRFAEINQRLLVRLQSMTPPAEEMKEEVPASESTTTTPN